MERFKEWYKDRHKYAKEWKEKTKGKVVGYFCTYVPEEILYAANILPVRILGSHEPQNVTEPHIFAMFCPFCRDCLAQGLQGRYDYLDGIMIAQSCLHIRQAYTSWDLHIPVDYKYYLPMPNNVQSKHSYPYLTYELMEFKKSVEEWIGRAISDEDLDKGIDILNTNRKLLRELYKMRRMDDPPISGLEAMYIVVSSQLVDKREHSKLLKETLEKEIRGRKKGKGVRLLIVGSENDDVEFIEMVESLDATFVIDDHCTGSRYFWNQVVPKEDRLRAIAERYIDRVPCPSKDWPERKRIKHILDLVEEYKVQGVILVQQKFCDPHELDIPALRKSLEDRGTPTLTLEFDVTVPVGQFKTRVEAFLEEMLLEEELF
jgi:benzoyl-CoA reductase subunit C